MAKTPDDFTIKPMKDVYTATIRVRELTLLKPVSCNSTDGASVIIPAGTVLRVSEVV